MTNPNNQSQLWDTLRTHQQEIAQYSLRQLTAEPNRKQKFSLTAANLLFDFSKNHLTEKTISLLCQLAEATQLPQRIEQMFQGEYVNQTEQRPALHTALRNRSDKAILVQGQDVMPGIQQTLQKMAELVDKVRQQQWLGYTQQPITDIVNIGIGGSYLGPHLVVKALAPYQLSSLRVHFIANVDDYIVAQALKNLNPATTLFIISSKSFTTVETLANAKAVLQWFQQTNNTLQDRAKHFIAVTNQPDKAIEFGIPAPNIFFMDDWVGGRYSLWSAIGLPAALAIGMENFYELLKGAYAIDCHFRQQPLHENMPVIFGLINIWYNNFFGTHARAILPYTELLKELPPYLQQLEMESTGKQVTQDGNGIDYPTGQIIFGETGTTGQHAFYQLLHQGTQIIPADFIVPLQGHHEFNTHQAILVANAFGHSKALMEGLSLTEVIKELQQKNLPADSIEKIAPHKVLPGNRPSNMLLFDKLTPFTLGALLALHEHKIFVQSVIWGINPFDQWGVEIGKKFALQLEGLT
ncbi:MAG: glucose-6-phosphate isomerase [Gammaproteobacteria bacterium]